MKINQKGFTIIELLIATTVFSLVLILIMAASIQMGRYFYKGISESRAQNASRQLMDDISNAIEFSGIRPQTSSTTYGTLTVESLCLGTLRFSYAKGLQVDDNVAYNPAANVLKVRHAVWRDNNADGECEPQDLREVTPSAGGEEVMPPGMRLTDLKIERPLNKAGNPVGELRRIDVRVMYGDTDTMNTTTDPFICLNTTQGGAFCGSSELHTTVMMRLQ